MKPLFVFMGIKCIVHGQKSNFEDFTAQIKEDLIFESGKCKF